MNKIIEKVLSANDIGATGAHQAGILVPKSEEILAFFPPLERDAVNPRAVIAFEDNLCQRWNFNFIYYNNYLRGGTRNEYRLTGMTAYLRESSAQVGDVLVFSIIDGDYYIKIRKATPQESEEDDVVTLVLNNNWKIINI